MSFTPQQPVTAAARAKAIGALALQAPPATNPASTCRAGAAPWLRWEWCWQPPAAWPRRRPLSPMARSSPPTAATRFPMAWAPSPLRRLAPAVVVVAGPQPAPMAVAVVVRARSFVPRAPARVAWSLLLPSAAAAARVAMAPTPAVHIAAPMAATAPQRKPLRTTPRSYALRAAAVVDGPARPTAPQPLAPPVPRALAAPGPTPSTTPVAPAVPATTAAAAPSATHPLST